MKDFVLFVLGLFVAFLIGVCTTQIPSDPQLWWTIIFTTIVLQTIVTALAVMYSNSHNDMLSWSRFRNDFGMVMGLSVVAVIFGVAASWLTVWFPVITGWFGL